MLDTHAIHPDDVFKSLRDQSNTRMQASLDILHEVCRNQKMNSSEDFSLPTIAALLKKHKGPSYQTLRNKNSQGERYRMLIEVWSRFSGGSMKKPARTIESPSLTILEKIPDPAVRGIVGGIIAENSRLKGEVHVLRQKVDYVIDRRPVQRIQNDANAVEGSLAPSNLTAAEAEALRHAISDKLLAEEGWILDDNGRIRTVNRRLVFKPGFATAIRKILQTLR